MITMQAAAIVIFASTMAVAAITIAVIIVVAAAATLIYLRTRTQKLQARFGPEYNRTLEETGNRYKAEAKLQRLEKRVERYPIRPLSVAERDRFRQSWRAVQARFVDDPIRALAEADQLLGGPRRLRISRERFRTARPGNLVDHATVVNIMAPGMTLRFASRRAKPLLRSCGRP